MRCLIVGERRIQSFTTARDPSESGRTRDTFITVAGAMGTTNSDERKNAITAELDDVRRESIACRWENVTEGAGAGRLVVLA